MKKLLLMFGAFALAIVTIPMFAAFEAHVINVTAQIENALSVSADHIPFGTVFPNEVAYKDLLISLSESFATSTQTRLDDVEYKIVQKPKPIPGTSGTTDGCIAEKAELNACIMNSMSTGGMTLQDAIMACYGGYDTTSCYPSLCQFLSKLPDQADQIPDVGVGSPHPIAECMDGIDNDGDGYIDYSADPECAQYGDNSEFLRGDQPQVYGKLAKSLGDLSDLWTLDLEVPCFIGQCKQGELGLLPPKWEHETFGCDLWVEVTGFSQAPR